MCADGHPLAATLYAPAALKAAVMIAPATGIKRGFYNAFATHLAENGYGVICFDNRGIGDSQQGPIRHSKASLVAWGQQDMPAALRTLQHHFPATTYHLVGHSAGGQLLGLMENGKAIASMFIFAASSGSLRNMHLPFSVKPKFFLNVFIPMNNALLGHTRSHWVGMGEPLPKMVAAQWTKWCNGQGYVATDFGKAIPHHHNHFADIAIPSKWLHATDDDIANYANVQDMIRVYAKTDAHIVTLDPKALGYKEIGHMKFFSSKYNRLWNHATEWLDTQVQRG